MIKVVTLELNGRSDKFLHLNQASPRIDTWGGFRKMNRRFPVRFVSLVLICCALPSFSVAGRADSAASKKAPRLGSEFELRVGQSVSLYKRRLSIRFVAVADDSRCPSDVTCVWAGNARVQLQVSNGRTSKLLTLNSNTAAPPPSDGSFKGYTLKLIGLNPYPRSTVRIARDRYVVKLMVSEN